VTAAGSIHARSDVPIIFLTAYADDDTLRRAKITGPYGYLVKPFKERDLHISIDMALYKHKMEKELKEREKWLATTLRSIGDGVITTDEKGLISFINPVAEALMGCKLEEVRQKNLTEVFNIVNRDTRKPVENPVTRVLLEGNIVGLANHTVLISRDGKEIPISDSAAPIKDDHGNTLGVILVFSDVTEREKAQETLTKSYAELQAANTSLRNSRRATLNIMEDALAARKRAEEAGEELRQSEERFRLLVTSVKDYAIFMLDPEGRIATWNEGAERLKGYTAEEIIGQQFSRFYPDEDVASGKPRRELEEATAEGQFKEEGWRVKRDGSRFWASVVITALRDDAGALRGFTKVTRDITERKQAEEVLRESEERVRVKLESILSPEGDIGALELADIIDVPAVQSLVDNLYEFVQLPVGILDLKGKVLVGVGWQDICTKFHRAHPDTCRHCAESDLELTKGVPAGEFRLYKCKNGMWDAVTPVMVGGLHMGNLFWGQFFFEDEPLDREFFRAQALKYGFNEEEYLAALERVPRISREALDTGMAFYLKLSDMLSKLSYSNIKLARSLSERDTLLHSLRESEEGLKRSQEIAHLGSWDLDLSNNSLSWSDEVYRIFGLQPQEFAATYEAFLEAVHPDDRAAVDAAYSSSLREGRDTYEIEHRVVKKATGEIRYVHEKCRHFRDETGRIIRSVGMVHDITERRQAEENILKLSEDMAARNEELEYVNSELEAFVYSVSHDLRAPIRHMSSFAKFMIEDYTDRLDDQGRDYLTRINKGSEKMSQLIDDLLHLSQISRQEISRTNTNMSKLASSIIADLREAGPSRSVKVDIEEGLTAYADQRLLEIVLSNLLGNAWKFTSKIENAHIEFGAVKEEIGHIGPMGLIYFVKDNGAGFDPEYMGKMFRPFQRLHSDKEFEGTGIGLAIVERVIRRHGGKIWAEGEIGKGATIYFTLD
jgi:PAS domain S-box-containing protein